MMSKIMIPVSILKKDTSKVERSVVGNIPTVKQRCLMLLVVIIYTTTALGAQTAPEWFEKGLEAFRWQKTTEAVAWFSKATVADPGNDEYFLYQGTCHHQLGQVQSAEDAYSAGIALIGANLSQILLNRGNLRMSAGNADGARSDYDRLVFQAGPLASSAMLNRANLNLNTGNHPSALDDYTSYLIMDPGTSQKEVIEQLIALLSQKIASDTEMIKIAAEQARLNEEARLAEEARIAQEEAERAAQMEELLKSLSESGDDTTNIEAGTEKVREDFEVSELED